MRSSARKAIWPNGGLTKEEFCEKVRAIGGEHARNDLPWRYISDPYAVLVSEVMLQQTQVKRVLNYWPNFLEQFPTIKALANSETAKVLLAWRGLGYNRRALALKKCAETVCFEGNGELPLTIDALVSLPGIGPATAAGVQAFARNLPCVYLETNVRTVFLHDLFPGVAKVPDRDLEPLVDLTCPDVDPREWYYNLLDYGAYLKTQVINPSRRSAGYTKQSKFEGSRRQKRSELVSIVLDNENGITRNEAFDRLNSIEVGAGRIGINACMFESLVKDLVDEGFFRVEGEHLIS